MDIRNWPLDKIMQLPDNAFGRKFMVAVEAQVPAGGTAFDIAEIAMPEQFVLWELSIYVVRISTFTEYVRIGLAQRLPASLAEFMLLDPLLHGLGIQGPPPRQIMLQGFQTIQTITVRMPFEAQSRKLALMCFAAETNHIWVRVVAVVSSIPKEVPDWIVSGLDKNLL